jgi:hypothetical protein
MGLLGDYLPDWLPDDPNQKAAARAGLLNFGAAMMGGRGNLGQILGGGLMSGSQGYAGSMDSQQKQALQAAQMNHYGLETKKLQNEIDEPMNLQKIISGGSAGTPSQGAARPLSELPRVGQPSGSPAAPAATPMPAQAPASLFQNYIDIGDRLTNAGKPANAKQYYDLAEKLRPKLKEQSARTVDGKRVMANVFDDGTTSTVEGFAPDAEKLSFQNTGGQTVALDPFTGKPVNTIANTQSPDSIASNATTRRGQNMTHDDNTAGDQAPITDAAILNAAARYNLDGTLPPMGMGKNAAAGRSAILNKAAVLMDGVDPSQQRRDQLTFKADNASQTAAVKAFTSGKQGNSVRSFNVSLSHLDTLSSLADALHNGDAKMLNKFGNYIAEQTGNPAPTNFDAAKKIVGDEVVKAIVGAGGGVHDREEAARVIASANSPAQLKGAIGTYQELMRGQLDGLQQQYEASTGRKDFNKFLSQHAQDTRGPASNAPQKAAAHPPGINSLLSKYGAHQ